MNVDVGDFVTRGCRNRDTLSDRRAHYIEGNECLPGMQSSGRARNEVIYFYSVSQEFPDLVKNMLLLKNPQFLPDHYETLSK